MTFLLSIVASVAAGLTIAGMLFFLRERWFAPPELTGRWLVEATTTSSSYRPFLQMRRTYVPMMVADRSSILGSAEIVQEDSIGRQKNLVGRERFLGKLAGRVVANIFEPDLARIHIEESGGARSSTTVMEIKIQAWWRSCPWPILVHGRRPRGPRDLPRRTHRELASCLRKTHVQ